MRIKIIHLAALAGALLPLSALAQDGGYVLLQKIGSLDRVAPNDFANYAQEVIFLIVGLSAALAVVMIVWGGFLYMLGESMNTKKEGWQRIQDAGLGLLLLLSTYLILYTINPDLLKLQLNPTPTNTGGAPRIVVSTRAEELSRIARYGLSQSRVDRIIADAVDRITGNLGLNSALTLPNIDPSNREILENERAAIESLRSSLVQASQNIEPYATAVAEAEYRLQTATNDAEVEQFTEELNAARQNLNAAANDLHTSVDNLSPRIDGARTIGACLHSRSGSVEGTRSCFRDTCQTNRYYCPQ